MATRGTKERPPLPPLDESRYDGWETWTNHRWAWEFLSRNKKFVEACQNVASGKRSARAVAKEFHLRRYKTFTEPYETTDVKNPKSKPAFLSSSVAGTQVPVIADEIPKARRQLRQLTIDIGQMFIRFDLTDAVRDSRRLDGQIKSAERALEKQLERLRTATMNTDTPGRERRNAEQHLELLKVLDLRQLDGTNAHRADAIFGNAENAVQTFESRLKAARNVATIEYRKLAAYGDDEKDL